jgi:hypothetical protein
MHHLMPLTPPFQHQNCVLAILAAKPIPSLAALVLPKLLLDRQATWPFTLHPTLAKDSILAAKVGSLQVRLVDDARFFWLLIVPETTATELHDLDEKTAESLCGN